MKSSKYEIRIYNSHIYKAATIQEAVKCWEDTCKAAKPGQRIDLVFIGGTTVLLEDFIKK